MLFLLIIIRPFIYLFILHHLHHSILGLCSKVLVGLEAAGLDFMGRDHGLLHARQSKSQSAPKLTHCWPELSQSSKLVTALL